MSLKRSRRLLVAAFALSLVLHLTAARFFRLTPAPQSLERVTLSRRTPLRIAKEVAPVPRPTVSPHVASRARAVPNLLVPQIRPGLHGAPGVTRIVRPAPSAAPTFGATPTPKAEETAAPACPKPNVAAALASSPPPPVLSAAARAGAVSGIAVVLVHLDGDGHVADTRLAQSSGSDELDIAAQQMARSAGYSPKYISCKAVAGDFTFAVKFFPW